MSTDRRTFIKFASGMLGGSLLAACGVQEGPVADRPQDNPIQAPNAFRFHTLKQDGDALPGGHRIDSVRYDAVLSDNGVIAYSAFDEEGRVGLYRLQVDAQGDEPRILDESVVLRELDPLDGGRATPVLGYDVAENGDVVVAHETLRWEDPIPVEELMESVEIHEHDVETVKRMPGSPNGDVVYRRDAAIYRAGARGEPEAIIRAGTVTDEGHVILGSFGPAIMRGHELLFTAAVEYAHPERATRDVGSAVWYLDDARAGAQRAQIVQRAGILPAAAFDTTQLGTSNVMRGFGLLDLQPGGRYGLQAFAGDPEERDEDTVTPQYAGNLLLAGDARRVGSAQVLAASQRSGVTPTSSAESIGVADLASGPRLAPDGTLGVVAQFGEASQRLYVGGRLFAASGDVTPSGRVIESFLPPVFGPQGETYVVAGSEDAMELLLFDGVSVRTLLATDDTLAGESTAISMLTLGTLIRQVNRDGYLVFTVVLEDGTSALVLGVPA